MKSSKLKREEFEKHAPANAGQQARVNHLGCPSGTDTRQRLYIKRTDASTIVAFCHNCGLSGYLGTPKSKAPTIKELKAKIFNSDAQETTEEVALPPDTTFVPKNWPINARAWLYKHRFTDDMITNCNIGYSAELDRVIIPVLNPVDFGFTSWQGRALDGSDPKYLTVSGTKKHPYICRGMTNNAIIITEDALSAIRVNYATLCETIALQGTHLSNDVIHHIIKFRKAVIWLDNDTAGRSGTLVAHKTLSAFFPVGKITIVTGVEEAKKLSDAEIKTTLMGTL